MTSRCFRAFKSSIRSRPRTRGRSRCHQAARSSSTTPKRWHPAQVVAHTSVDGRPCCLNEHRNGGPSIEQPFKVNVLLVPNRHLAPRNYRIERLRHDELNLGEPLPASFRVLSLPREGGADNA